MALAPGAATPTSASTVDAEDWRLVCGKVEMGKICISAPSHAGRHAYRLAIEAEQKVREMKELAMADHEDEEVELGEKVEARIEPKAVMEAVKGSWTPEAEDFLNLKGKAYLPARRRVQWFREEHKDWTIDTDTEVFERGKRTGPGRVEDGFAVVRANIFNPDGQLISTGLKSEYSENFADFLEKAETGAIARALAIAGFGTENALDLDEGVDADRIADSPVERKPRITSSAVPGVGRGGKTDGASVAQIRRVAELSRELSLGAIGLAGVIENILDITIPSMPEDEIGQNRAIATLLSTRSSDEVGKVIAALEAAVGK